MLAIICEARTKPIVLVPLKALVSCFLDNNTASNNLLIPSTLLFSGIGNERLNHAFVTCIT